MHAIATDVDKHLLAGSTVTISAALLIDVNVKRLNLVVGINVESKVIFMLDEQDHGLRRLTVPVGRVLVGSMILNDSIVVSIRLLLGPNDIFLEWVHLVLILSLKFDDSTATIATVNLPTR